MMNELKGILGIDEINCATIDKILNNLDIEHENLIDLMLYKQLETFLIKYYREIYFIDISRNLHDKEEIIGLLAFVHLKTHNQNISSEMEIYFENLFFKKEDYEEIKIKNKRLEEHVQALEEKIEHLEKQIEEQKYDFEDVDVEVMKKLERENVHLKNKLEFENEIVINAWHKLCEDHLKNNF